tara:strand:+ start:233 stop:445 length:213 start_codon:yes stop_codon:yes gene_type:complete
MITDNDIIFDHLYEEFKDFMDDADEVVSIRHYMEDNGIPKETMYIMYETYVTEKKIYLYYELKKENETKK